MALGPVPKNAQRFPAYVNNHKYADMYFAVKGDKNGRVWHLPAHRIIVATASSPLILTRIMKLTETENVIYETRDADREHMEQVLSFIYTGTIELSPENYDGIATIARQLELAQLIDYCQKARPDAWTTEMLNTYLSRQGPLKLVHSLVPSETDQSQCLVLRTEESQASDDNARED